MSDFDYKTWKEQDMKEFWQRLRDQMEREPDKYPPKSTVSVASNWVLAILVLSFVFAFGSCLFYSSVPARVLSGLLSIELVGAGALMMRQALLQEKLVGVNVSKTILKGILYVALIMFSSATTAIAFSGNIAALLLIGLLCILTLFIWAKWFINALVVHGV